MANTGNEKVPFFKLFSFADGVDKGLMVAGTIGAILTGLAQPVMTVMMGELVNSFGTAVDNSQVLRVIGQVK